MRTYLLTFAFIACLALTGCQEQSAQNNTYDFNDQWCTDWSQCENQDYLYGEVYGYEYEPYDYDFDDTYTYEYGQYEQQQTQPDTYSQQDQLYYGAEFGRFPEGPFSMNYY